MTGTTQYAYILAKLFAAIVQKKSYKDVTSLLLQGTTYCYDTNKVLRDVDALADVTTRTKGQEGMAARFSAGLLWYSVEFSSRDRGMYDALGLSHYFDEVTIQRLALK